MALCKTLTQSTTNEQVVLRPTQAARLLWLMGILSMAPLPFPLTRIIIDSAWHEFSGYKLVFESDDCSSHAWIDVSRRAMKHYESRDGQAVEAQSNVCLSYGTFFFKIAENTSPRTAIVPKSFLYFSDYVTPDSETGKRAVEAVMISKHGVRYRKSVVKCRAVKTLNVDAIWKRFDDVTSLMPPSLPLMPIELKSTLT